MSGGLKTVLALAGVAAVLVSGNALSARVRPEVEMPSVGLGVAQQERLDKLASASLFGQFRSSMADFLWLKVDKYIHNGVDLRGLTPLEKETRDADRVASKEKGWKHRGDETTVVPSAARDWRGPFGDIEREVRPYKDMANHTHRNPKETLPLFRLMTWSNPHFIPGYVVGAEMIAHDPQKNEEAIQFLLEGEKNNPNNLEIETAVGQAMTAKTKQFDRALPHLRTALATGASRDRKTFTEDEDEAYEDAFRWMVLNRRESHDLPAARAAAKVGLSVYPTDVVCRRFLEQYGAE